MSSLDYDTELGAEELRRYGRHLVIPEVGIEGQKRLKASRILVVGAGGLGSPVSMYLAAAGVGTLGLVEFDRVEESNLQRQILFAAADVGRPKIEVAQERLLEINPLIRIAKHPFRLDSSNADRVLEAYDLVVDGSDNFPTRYLVNDACVLAGKPYVYGSIFRFEGQVSVFGVKQGPCYRCLFPEPPPPGLVPSCAEGGVLGVLPGIVGSLQANEAIKLVLGIGEPLIARLVIFDALGLRFRELRLRRNPACVVCGDTPSQTGLIDYEQFCGVGNERASEDDFNVTVGELKMRLDAGERVTLIDVRTPREWAIARLENAELMPLPELADRWQEIDRTHPIVVYCHHGHRSARAVDFLRRMGLPQVKNLEGGIDAWSKRIDPGVPAY